MKRFLEWLIRTYYPDLLKADTWVDDIIRDTRFKVVDLLVNQAEETKSQGPYKHIYVATAVQAEARRNGRPAETKDINFMIELALQLKKRRS